MSDATRRPVSAGRLGRAGRNRRALLALVPAGALLLAGCTGSPGPEVTASATSTVTPSIDPSKDAVPPVPTVWPLTGEKVDAVAERPAISVKIENTSAARPQTGLEDADIVWEEIVEFDVPRFVATFHSKTPKEVGPIRSTRPMDDDIAAPIGGALAFSGGQGGIVKKMKKAGLVTLSNDAGDGGFWRSSARRAPHNVYGDVSKFLSQASKAKAPAETFRFAADAATATAAASGKKATGVTTKMSSLARPAWKWSAEKKAYLRSEGSTAAKVASGAQISATNVVLLDVKHKDSGYNAQGGTAVPDMTGKKGKGAVLQGGKFVEVTWTKDGVGAPFVLLDDKGAPVLLAPGNTWVELVPHTGSFTLTGVEKDAS